MRADLRAWHCRAGRLLRTEQVSNTPRKRARDDNHSPPSLGNAGDPTCRMTGCWSADRVE